MVGIELYKRLERLVAFDAKRVSQITGASASYARLLIHRMRRKGTIREIERNRYTLHDDAFLVASHVAWPSYISGWAALNYHHLTEQLPSTITVITTRSRRNREIPFGNSRIAFTRVKPRYFFGYGKVAYRDFEIFVADREKSILDAVLLKRISFSAIADIMKKNRDQLDLGRLADYATRAKDPAAIKRLGYLIERLGGNARPLRRLVKGGCIPLDYAMPPGGKKVEGWRVTENVEL